MTKAETLLTPPEDVAAALETARAELENVNIEIIRKQALFETEQRLQSERHTKILSAEYQRVMQSAIIAKQEADEYSKRIRATIDEEAKTERQRRTDEIKCHAQKMTQLGKQHREIQKANAAEAELLRSELDRIVADRSGELEKRFQKTLKFLDGIQQALESLAAEVLDARIQPIAGKKPAYIPLPETMHQ